MCNYNMDIISRQQAKQEGLTKYFTGKPCKHGHIGERWVSTLSCILCTAEKAAKWREENIEHRREYVLQYRQQHPEKDKLYRSRRTEEAKQRYNHTRSEKRRKNPLIFILYQAKRRARELDLPFNLTINDLVIPEFCPVLGIPLYVGNKKSTDNSPSIDRLIPKLGYVAGNVIIVSFKANRIKTDATLKELEQVYEFYKKILPDQI